MQHPHCYSSSHWGNLSSPETPTSSQAITVSVTLCPYNDKAYRADRRISQPRRTSDTRNPLVRSSSPPIKLEEGQEILHKRPIECSVEAAHKRLRRAKVPSDLNTTPPRIPPTTDDSTTHGQEVSAATRQLQNNLSSLPQLVQTFDAMNDEERGRLLMDLLARSSKDTLQLASSVIRPALRSDRFSQLPTEITLLIISHLDARAVCQVSAVSKHWYTFMNQAAQVWRHLIIVEGFDKYGALRTAAELDNQDNAITPYKRVYQRNHMLRHNWRRGRARTRNFPGHPQHVVTCLQLDDDKIISGADDGLINIYNAATGDLLRTLEGHEGGVWALQYIGNALVSGSTDRTVRVWDIERGVCTHIFTGHTSTVRCLQIVMPTMVDGRLQPSKPLIVSGSRDRSLRVWRLPDPETDPPYNGQGENPYFLYRLLGHGDSVRAITADGNYLVSGSYDHFVCVWNLETGQLLHRMQGHSQKVYSVVIDRKRNRCMSGSLDGTVKMWDLENGTCIKTLEGHAILVGLLGLTENHLVSAAADATLRVWSPDTGICLHALYGHTEAITCFQHDDEKVISGSEGGLKLWDIKTGKHIKDLIEGVNGVWRVAFDRRRCVAAVYENNITSFQVLDFGDGIE